MVPWRAKFQLRPFKEKFTRAELTEFSGEDGLEVKQRLMLFADELEALAQQFRDTASKLG